MANETLLRSEIMDWYNTFNSIISNYGGNITQLSSISADSLVKVEHINNLFNKITEFKNDEYLQTEPQLYATEYTLLNTGTVIKRTNSEPIITVASNITQIKCRNFSTCSQGNNSITGNSVTCSYGCSQNTSCSHGSNSVSCSYGTNTNARACQNGRYSSCCNSYTEESGVRCSNGTCSYSSRSYSTWNNRTNSKHSDTCTNSTHTNAIACDNGTCTKTCSDTCTNCNNTTCSQACTQICTYGVCSQGGYIDILNSNKTHTV